MKTTDEQEITRLLNELSSGNKEAEKKLISIIYSTLHSLARRHRLNWNRSDTLNTTALVHEAYLKLLNNPSKKWENRRHFFAVASQAMRSIIVDHARRQKTDKRGNPGEHLPLQESLLCPPHMADDILALDEALNRLNELDERHSRIVEYRFFCGFNIEETAELMMISSATVKRDWKLARSWLYQEIKRSTG